jgi:hypothetical protein
VQNALPFASNLYPGGFQQTYPQEQGAAVQSGQSQTYGGRYSSIQLSKLLCLAVQNALPFAANLQLGGGFQQTYPQEQGAAVAPGHTQTCVWQVPPTLGPGKQDFSTVAYTYRSTVNPAAHENAGLIGAAVIGRLVSSSSLECALSQGRQVYFDALSVVHDPPT